MDFGITSVAVITVMCYFASEIIKITRIKNKLIPIICGGVGGVLGIVAMHIMPSYPADDYFNAIALGMVSGFAATGVNQVGKQLFNK